MISKFEKKRRVFKPTVLDMFKRSLDTLLCMEKNNTVLFKDTKSTKDANFSNIKNICAILSGGPAPGGHNVICGIYDSLVKSKTNSIFYGAISGPSGLVDGNLKVIDRDLIERYRNHGGFDMLGSGRTKLNKKEQFDSVIAVCKERDINVIIIIGGDDSNTNAAIMAEYFEKNNADITVVGVPKTIDGDLRNENIEVTFGFDSAVRVYSELISNIENDAVSSRKYYHFIKLMGRSASHIALECALQCHPNVAIISEEVRAQGKTLDDVAEYIANIIRERRKRSLNFGVILIPEGLLEFTQDICNLIDELNAIIASAKNQTKEEIVEKLSPNGLRALNSIPLKYQDELLMTRDSHGNVQFSNIESEKIIAEKVNEKLNDSYFAYQTHFFGYEGRCGFPTNFDCVYTYNLGITAYLLALHKKSGYICFIKNVAKNIKKWQPGGMQLSSMIKIENRNGKETRVIEKALVDLDSKTFKYYKCIRDSLAVEDDYVYVGPIQFVDKTIEVPLSLQIENKN